MCGGMIHAMAYNLEPDRLNLPELTEDQVLEQGPAVRAQLIHRLEGLYQLCEEELGSTDGRDARWAELQLRALDRVAKLYRLVEAPRAAPEPEAEPAVVRDRTRALVTEQLRQLEARAVGEGS